jgi:acylaminoacyl-peptidase
LTASLGGLHSAHALNISQEWIFASLESYTRKPVLILGKLTRDHPGVSHWIYCDDEENEAESFSSLGNVELLKFRPRLTNSSYPLLELEAVLVKSNHSNSKLVAFPHGGPHQAFGCEFSYHVAVFLKLGFSILLINYRGSCNFGQDFLLSLPGHIGTYDVIDCHVIK